MGPINQEKPLWRWTEDSRESLLQLSDLAAPTRCANTTNCCAGSSEGKKNNPVFFPISAPVPSATPTSSAAIRSHRGGEMGGQLCAALSWYLRRKNNKQLPRLPVFPFLFVSLHPSLPPVIPPYLGPHSGTQCSPQNMWFLLARGTHARARKRTELSVTHPKPGVLRRARSATW